MAESWRNGLIERDVEQAITTLKKGAQLLKYGRRGKPKFCPFRLSADETCLIWYSGRKEKQLKLSTVSKIIPGQRTAIFQRYPRPDKEYQSFSLIYNDRSLDVICKDKDDAEVWFVGLKALISPVNPRKWRIDSSRISSDTRGDRFSCDTVSTVTSTQRNISPLNTESFRKDPVTAQLLQNSYETHPANTIGKVASDVILYTTLEKSSFRTDSVSNVFPTSALESENTSNAVSRGSAVDSFRVSLSSAVSSSSHGSGYEEFDALGDVFIWGEGAGEGIFGGGIHKSGISTSINVDATFPKALESTVVLDIHNISCGSRHAAIVTRQGEVFTWGEECGGRLGHGVDADVSHPKLIDALNGINIEFLACGEYHTCAVSFSGDLYTWGDGYYKSGLLGNSRETSHWIPRKVNDQIDGLHISYVSCGPWHTAIVTSAGQMFTFGDGTFGVLGHGDCKSVRMPREVDALKGMRVVRAACGVWHSAALVEITETALDSNLGKLFTWGNGDKGRLGHGDTESRLLPAFVAALCEHSFCQVACGNDVTISLAASGQVFTMGSTAHGQLGNPTADGKLPTTLDERFRDVYVEEISCGSYHAAVLTSKTEVYTWGKGANGRLGHGDVLDRDIPTLVEALKDKQVKSVVCGSNFTAVICLHKWVSSADQSICSGCRLPFGFRRKRHNCYNCGLVFCKLCSSKKSVKASLAPSMNKPYRVCDECYTKIKKSIGSGVAPRKSKQNHGSQGQINSEAVEKDGIFTKPAQLSRLSSILSFKGENKQSRQQVRFEIDNSKCSETDQSSSSTSLHGSSKNVFFVSVPNSRTDSHSSSIKTRPGPHKKSTSVVHDLAMPTVTDSSIKVDNDLSQEVARLQLQVEELTHEAQNLEAELATTKKQLKEVTIMAEENSSKYRSANEVIKSLTERLKDMAGKVPDAALHTSSPLKSQSDESLVTVAASPSQKSNGDSGAKEMQKEVDWVEQIEPGVYITLSHIHGGGKLLKRVRFSRRRFSEQKANQWWAENRSKLQERYTILSQ